MILPLGQPSALPAELTGNPFYRLIVKFSRYKTGSLETLFAIESILLRYAWVGLLVMCALVFPPLEEVDGLGLLVRLTTVVYPFFFIWSLTRISGVELLQLVLEGHWTGEVLTSPIDNRDLTRGFITPLWLTFQRYWLISFFSLALYCLETSVLTTDNAGHLIGLQELARRTWFSEGLFFSAIAWIVFVYMARLFGEARLRNGLLKGLSTVALLMVGLVLMAGYCVLLFVRPEWTTHVAVLWTLTGLTAALLAGSALLHRRLARNFRRYVAGQIGIDLLIFDNLDLHSTAWSEEQ